MLKSHKLWKVSQSIKCQVWKHKVQKQNVQTKEAKLLETIEPDNKIPEDLF